MSGNSDQLLLPDKGVGLRVMDDGVIRFALETKEIY